MTTKFDPTPLAVEAEEALAHDDEDLTKEEIIAGLRQALKEALAGEGRPAREAIADIRRKIYGDGDPS